jgi:hypothetical protein
MSAECPGGLLKQIDTLLHFMLKVSSNRNRANFRFYMVEVKVYEKGAILETKGTPSE